MQLFGKRMIFVALGLFALGALLALGLLIRHFLSPMLVCLTFDDGFKVHSELAAPLLKKYGFTAAFNVPTGFMFAEHSSLTAEQVQDFRLLGNGDVFMTWSDLKDLLAVGHEVYPHGVDHADPKVLECDGNMDELRRQIVDAKRQFAEQLGFEPKFFCTPHNSCSVQIRMVIHENGMEIFAPGRIDCGGDGEGVIQKPIDGVLRMRHRAGYRLTDLMIHGIDCRRGGWRPFKTAEDFEEFLMRIKQVEQDGVIRVVPYSCAHRPLSLFSSVLSFHDKALSKLARLCIKFIYK